MGSLNRMYVYPARRQANARATGVPLRRGRAFRPWRLFGLLALAAVGILTIMEPALAQGDSLMSPKVWYEGDGQQTLRYIVKTTGKYKDVRTTYTIETAGSATPGTDYALGTPVKTRNPIGDIRILHVDVPIEFKADSLDESDETIDLKFYCDCGPNDEKTLANTFTLTLKNAARPVPKFSVTSISLDEGATTTYGLSLNADPGASETVVVDVRLEIGGTNLLVGPVKVGKTASALGSSASFSFTGGPSGNWATPQTVTLQAEKDWEKQDYSVNLVHVVDKQTLAKFTKKLKVSVTNKTAGLLVSETALTVKEGAVATFEVELIGDPRLSGSVSVAIPEAQRGSLEIRSGRDPTGSFGSTAHFPVPTSFL